MYTKILPKVLKSDVAAPATTNNDPKCKPKINKETFKKLETSIDGCGPPGLHVAEPFGLTQCCDKHDYCYGDCGRSFKECEFEFQDCAMKVCKSLGAVLVKGNGTVGDRKMRDFNVTNEVCFFI